MATAAPQNPEIYWACFGLTVTNVGSKFTQKKVVKSRPFRCEQDPNNVYFEMRLIFGSENSETWLQAHVRNLTSDVTYKGLKYTLLDSIDNEIRIMQHVNLDLSTTKGNDFGWEQFFDADILANPDSIVWRFICEVEYGHVLPVDPPANLPNSNIGNDYLRLWESGENADVTFIVQDVEIKAHKTVLIARSSYFRTMFSTNMNESSSGKINVPDADPSAFRSMLEFLYGGSSPKDLGIVAMDLFAIADKYDMRELAELCEAYILDNINADNVIDALLLAEQHGRKNLMARAKIVLKANLNIVQRSKNRKKLEQRPALLIDLFVHYAGQ